MSGIGYLQIHAYASKAYIPLKQVAVQIMDSQGTPIAYKLTDRSGLISPVEIETPSRSNSLIPNTNNLPFATVTVAARLENYEQIVSSGIQIFPDTTTVQELEMIPIAEFPDSWSRSEAFQTIPQNL